MTVVAYRDGVMACDSLWVSGQVKILRLTKIIRLASGALFGDSGDVDNRGLIKVLADCKDSQSLPSAEELDAVYGEFSALLVFPNGTGWRIRTTGAEQKGGSGSFPAWRGKRGFSAIGSGADVALGAMEAGATAFGAVKAACNRNIYCAPPIHVLKLLQTRKEK